MNPSLRVATLRGIPIEIHPSWFITFVLVSFTLAVGLFPTAHPGLTALGYWVLGIVGALIFFTSVLIHELAHSLVALAHGIPIRRITLFIFGGVAQIASEPNRPGIEFQVAIAGPLASLGLAGLFWLLSRFFGLMGLDPVSVLTAYLTQINLILALFNLVPAFPLDGGRVFRAVLWSWTRDLQRATQVAATVGQAFALFLLLWGMVGAFAGQLVQGLWMAFIGWFLYQASQTGQAQVMLRRTLAGVPVSQLMSPQVKTVPADLPLRQLVEDYFFRYRFTAFPVLQDGQLVGMVSLREVSQQPSDRWDSLRVRDVAVPLEERDFIEPDADAADALLQMAERGVGRLLVIEGQRLVGLVSHTDILRLIRIHQELRV